MNVYIVHFQTEKLIKFDMWRIWTLVFLISFFHYLYNVYSLLKV